jgi:hypothetical protein
MFASGAPPLCVERAKESCGWAMNHVADDMFLSRHSPEAHSWHNDLAKVNESWTLAKVGAHKLRSWYGSWAARYAQLPGAVGRNLSRYKI